MKNPNKTIGWQLASIQRVFSNNGTWRCKTVLGFFDIKLLTWASMPSLRPK